MKLLLACLLALVQLYTHFSQLLSVLRYWGERLRALKDTRSGEKNNFECLSRAAAVVTADSLPSSINACSGNSYIAAVGFWCFFLYNPWFDLSSEGMCSGRRGIYAEKTHRHNSTPEKNHKWALGLNVRMGREDILWQLVWVRATLNVSRLLREYTTTACLSS